MISRQSFTYAPSAIVDARRFVVSLLHDVDSNTVEDVALMVSELATNSFRHADSSFTVIVDRSETRLTVSVIDTGPGEPQLQSPQPAEATGRGLRIVSALSDEWGVSGDGSGDGKSVWFTVDLAARSRTSHFDTQSLPDAAEDDYTEGRGNGTAHARHRFAIAA